MPGPITGQVALTGSAQTLSAGHVACTAFTIKAASTNVHVAYIGGSAVTTGTGYPMGPGDEFTYERSTQAGQGTYQLGPGDFYAVGTSGDVVGWLASP